MNAAQDLLLAPTLLAAIMTNEPRFLLVRAIAWLDPDSLLTDAPDPRYIDFDYDAEDTLTVGLHISRECFPAVYAGVMQLQLQGAEERTVKRYLLEGINAQLVFPVQDLEELRYGPPIDFCGVDLHSLDPEDAENPPYDRLLPLFALFGLSENGDEGHETETAAVSVARALIHSLTTRTESPYHDLANLLLWMFSFSGNTAVDYTLEVFWENGFDMPDWANNDIALINDINREAHDLMTSALNALALLETDTDLFCAFSRNIKTVLNAVHRQKGKSHARTLSGDPDPAALLRHTRWPGRP